MQFPDDIVRLILQFLKKPKLMSKHEWLDFYLDKIELRYEVGMQFAINEKVHTISCIKSGVMFTNVKTDLRRMEPEISIFWVLDSMFQYNETVQMYDSFPWSNLIGNSMSFKQKKYITVALQYLKTRYIISTGRQITNRNKYHQLMWRDYNNDYATWGAIVTKNKLKNPE